MEDLETGIKDSDQFDIAHQDTLPTLYVLPSLFLSHVIILYHHIVSPSCYASSVVVSATLAEIIEANCQSSSVWLLG